ncbi:class I SAM-dependent RNA methyltransferase [Polaromonas sp. JS666]|uniref:THUMP domain-containing class I SAM-dependent RNA methyltransferase n=1 Tax=Polaromonas sp. (strain JS666 / ATCC BAA-500) TaxID=296591 RepID=UPI00087FC472|nr:THUMP domain-containing protein [Polaromonas sp. JS666]SDO11465.1 putative N6-adenine-specific DNA methylase [Polaromonas sp. JS666]
MNQLQLFLPCAAGVEALLASEVQRITGIQGKAWRAGVQLQASWRDALQLNLHSRLAQRVLIELQHNQYRGEQDLYNAAANVAWEIWFTPKQTFKVEITAQHSPLTSLNFAALKIKDAIADRFRAKFDDVRPSVDTRWPDVRVYVHLTTDTVTIYIDTSGEPLFKRGWREDKGDAPLKETLAAAMIAASGWDQLCKTGVPLYDPCCGSGTIAIEAAQIACNIAPGINRRFAFQKYLPFQGHVWDGLLDQAEAAITEPTAPVFGSDVSFRMVDFAERNAERAGVANAVEFRGGDALQRMPPAPSGVMLVNPPYGERIDVAGVAGITGVQGRDQRRQQGHAEGRVQHDHRNQPIDEFGQPLRPDSGDTREEPAFETSRDRSANPGREQAQNAWGEEADDFFPQLAAHWKKNYAGWTAHVLTPDLKLPGKMRLKESRRVPMWNGPIECRLFRFDMVAGSARGKPGAAREPAP